MELRGIKELRELKRKVSLIPGVPYFIVGDERCSF
jgi:hypothetical protein